MAIAGQISADNQAQDQRASSQQNNNWAGLSQAPEELESVKIINTPPPLKPLTPNSDPVKARAELTRRTWEDYQNRDVPHIKNFADTITSGLHRDRALAQARNGVAIGLSNASFGQELRDRSIGVSLSDEQQFARNSSINRSGTASMVDAENSANRAAIDRENAAIAGAPLEKK